MKCFVITSACAILVGLSSIQSAHAVLFDQTVTPGNGVTNGMIFGSGNNNGFFVVDRNQGVELGLRAKLRHNDVGLPENTFPSNGAGGFIFDVGVAPTQSFPTAVWSFEWAINTNYDGSASGRNLADLVYTLALDMDPGPGTSFLEFDPINVACADHSIGTNATPGGGGTEASCPGGDATYANLIADNNVAQQSWKPHWFIPGFDPTIPGIYDISLTASSPSSPVPGVFLASGPLASTSMQVFVGKTTPLPEPATLTLLAFGLLGLGFMARRKRSY